MRECLKGVILHARYRIEEVLGYGGFAITYRALDTDSEATVAVKEYFPKSGCMREADSNRVCCTEDPEFFQKNKDRFLREAQTLEQLCDMSEVVRILDRFEENGTVYIVMEYVEGRTLSGYVKEQGAFEWEALAPIMRQIIDTLIRIHERGMIHRDVSPENIMLLADGSVKLLDFGAVKEVGTTVQVGDALTRPTEAIVKKGFAPVEQYQNWGNLGPWTDVYGLCATIYFCLTEKTLPDAMDRVLGVEEYGADADVDDRTEQAAREREAVERKIPGHVREAVEKGTQIRIADRLRSMKELYELLFEDGTRGQGNEKGHKRRKRRGMLIGAILAAAALVFGAVWFLGTRDRDYTLRPGEDIQACMDKPYVKKIIIPSGVESEADALLIEKRVEIRDGGMLTVGSLTIADGGSIRVEGALALENSVVRITRGGCCVEIAEGGSLGRNENTLFWTTGEEYFLQAESEEGPNLSICRTIKWDEETLFADAVSVTSYEELKAAAESGNEGRAISIDADIDIPEEIRFMVPIRISEGVTVRGSTEGIWFNVWDAGLFVNYGVLGVPLIMGNDAAAVNYGRMELGTFENWCSLWITGDGVFVNAGTVDTHLGTSLWENSSLYNLGEMNFYYMSMRGGCLFNSGMLQVCGNEYEGFSISKESVLYQRGTMRILPDMEVYNYSRIENTGKIIVENNAVFASALLINNGYFEANNGARLGDFPGVYFGDGEYRLTGTIGSSRITRCQGDAAAIVSTQEQLTAALSDERISAVFADKEMIVTSDLNVEKPLFLYGGLSVQNDAQMRFDGGGLFLMREAQISDAELRLQNGSIVCGAADLSIWNSRISLDENSTWNCCNSDILLSGTQIENAGQIDFRGWSYDDSFVMDNSNVTGSGMFTAWR